MVLRDYPQEIKRLMAAYKPYELDLFHGNTTNVPAEAVDAFEKVKQWAWEQGQ